MIAYIHNEPYTHYSASTTQHFPGLFHAFLYGIWSSSGQYVKENTHHDLFATKKEKHQRRTWGKMEFLKLRYPEYSFQNFYLQSLNEQTKNWRWNRSLTSFSTVEEILDQELGNQRIHVLSLPWINFGANHLISKDVFHLKKNPYFSVIRLNQHRSKESDT